MAGYDDDLLTASRMLLRRRSGQRGRLPSARIRRSISTTYYALFHFLLDEIGRHLIGTSGGLRIRRRLLSRTVSHTGIKTALDKVRGRTIDRSVADFLCSGSAAGTDASPPFIRDLAKAFSDAHAKRQEADYNLSEPFSVADARLLRLRVRRVIRNWRSAKTVADREAKKALCMLMLLKGQLRVER